jgi:hypothetical protein
MSFRIAKSAACRLLLLPLLLLAGCSWTGEAFYAASEAQAAIAPGNYRTDESASPGPNVVPIRISVLPSGLTSFDLANGERGESLAGFVPLGSDGRFHIFWLARFDGRDVPADGVPYGLIERLADGHYKIYLPDCGHDRADAVAAGAMPVSQGGQSDCRFPNRASLEAGMRAYAAHPFDGMELIPVQ